MRLIAILALILLAVTSNSSVIGVLPRIAVSNPLNSDLQKVGLITNADGIICTGTLIGPAVVLTAAHCLYDLNTKIKTEGLEFYQGRNGITFSAKAIAVNTIPNPIYVRDGNPNYDVGIILLDQNLGLQAGHLNIQYTKDNFTWNETEREFIALGTIAGYPGDKLFGNMFMVPCFYRQKPFNFDFFARSQSDKVEYECDTYGGMSGSALMTGDGNGGSIIIGVHTNGTSVAQKRNSGVLLTGETLDFVNQFKSYTATIP